MAWKQKNKADSALRIDEKPYTTTNLRLILLYNSKMFEANSNVQLPASLPSQDDKYVVLAAKLTDLPACLQSAPAL